MKTKIINLIDKLHDVVFNTENCDKAIKIVAMVFAAFAIIAIFMGYWKHVLTLAVSIITFLFASWDLKQELKKRQEEL